MNCPYDNYLAFFDGTTIGPTNFSGPIGKKLMNVSQNEITNFQIINCTLPDLHFSILSKDQNYMYHIAL